MDVSSSLFVLIPFPLRSELAFGNFLIKTLGVTSARPVDRSQLRLLGDKHVVMFLRRDAVVGTNKVMMT